LSGTVEGFPVLSASFVSFLVVRCCTVDTSEGLTESTSFGEIVGVQGNVMAKIVLMGTTCFLFGILLGFLGGWIVGSNRNNHEIDDDDDYEDED
jgi:hypothetical protein